MLIPPLEEDEPDPKDGKKLGILDRLTAKEKPAMEKIAKKKPSGGDKLSDKDTGLSMEVIAEKRARLEKLAAEERIDLSNLPRKSNLASSAPLDHHTQDHRFALIAAQITLETIDRGNLPPGFPPEPPKPFFREGGSEEEYKDYMRQRLKYEEWENNLLLWHRKNTLEHL